MVNKNSMAITMLFFANIATLLFFGLKEDKHADNLDLTNPTIGEVTLFAGNFAPRGWYLCHGQLISINENQALFSILGTTYGGDGRTTFALPDLRGRTAIGQGSGPGLQPRQLGQKVGQQVTVLNQLNLPAHNHSVNVSMKLGDGLATTELGNDKIIAVNTGTAPIYTENANETTFLRSSAFNATSENAGASQSFSIEQPSLGLNYIIAYQGTFPSRD